MPKKSFQQIQSMCKRLQWESFFSSSDDGIFLGRWKVLMYWLLIRRNICETYRYDEYCKNIITPLMNNYELRKGGVTLHLSISQPRDKITGMPVIYFVEPTETNVRYARDLVFSICSTIISDLSSNLYDVAYLNFSSPLSKYTALYVCDS